MLEFFLKLQQTACNATHDFFFGKHLSMKLNVADVFARVVEKELPIHTAIDQLTEEHARKLYATENGHFTVTVTSPFLMWSIVQKYFPPSKVKSCPLNFKIEQMLKFDESDIIALSESNKKSREHAVNLLTLAQLSSYTPVIEVQFWPINLNFNQVPNE